MSYTRNPEAPEKEAARQAAEDLAENLRAIYPEHPVRIEESIKCQFEVVVEVRFRKDYLTWAERQEKEEGVDGSRSR